jgi:hypothetical protein
MKMLFLLFILFVPIQDYVLRDKVDLVEYNHFYDENMNHKFDQLIFYDWSNQKKRFQVRDWRMVGIAQLVERLLCKQNVVGSNPSTSTVLGHARGTFSGAELFVDDNYCLSMLSFRHDILGF